MRISEIMAAYFAENITDADLTRLLGPMAERVTKEQLITLFGKGLEETVADYLSGSEFSARLDEAVEHALTRIITNRSPVYVLDQKRFDEYRKDNELIGPIASVYTHTEPYDPRKMGDEVMQQARAYGGNVIVLVDVDSRQYDGRIYRSTWAGEVYINSKVWQHYLSAIAELERPSSHRVSPDDSVMQT